MKVDSRLYYVVKEGGLGFDPRIRESINQVVPPCEEHIEAFNLEFRG